MVQALCARRRDGRLLGGGPRAVEHPGRRSKNRWPHWSRAELLHTHHPHPVARRRRRALLRGRPPPGGRVHRGSCAAASCSSAAGCGWRPRWVLVCRYAACAQFSGGAPGREDRAEAARHFHRPETGRTLASTWPCADRAPSLPGAIGRIPARRSRAYVQAANKAERPLPQVPEGLKQLHRAAQPQPVRGTPGSRGDGACACAPRCRAGACGGRRGHRPHPRAVSGPDRHRRGAGAAADQPPAPAPGDPPDHAAKVRAFARGGGRWRSRHGKVATTQRFHDRDATHLHGRPTRSPRQPPMPWPTRPAPAAGWAQ